MIVAVDQLLNNIAFVSLLLLLVVLPVVVVLRMPVVLLSLIRIVLTKAVVQ